jgi:hypothetical protein
MVKLFIVFLTLFSVSSFAKIKIVSQDYLINEGPIVKVNKVHTTRTHIVINGKNKDNKNTAAMIRKADLAYDAETSIFELISQHANSAKTFSIFIWEGKQPLYELEL